MGARPKHRDRLVRACRGRFSDPGLLQVPARLTFDDSRPEQNFAATERKASYHRSYVFGVFRRTMSKPFKEEHPLGTSILEEASGKRWRRLFDPKYLVDTLES